jgi:hypothetical protein
MCKPSSVTSLLIVFEDWSLGKPVTDFGTGVWYTGLELLKSTYSETPWALPGAGVILGTGAFFIISPSSDHGNSDCSF